MSLETLALPPFRIVKFRPRAPSPLKDGHRKRLDDIRRRLEDVAREEPEKVDEILSTFDLVLGSYGF